MENLPTVRDSFALLQYNPEEFREVLDANFGAETISAFDLERIKVPSGGAMAWEVPTLEGDAEYVKELRGIILKHQLVRTYWEAPFEGREASTPPTCQSFDGKEGHGNPGGMCQACPLNQFGSATDGAPGKACREGYMIFFVREGALMPSLLIAPVMSVRPFRKYLVALVSRALPVYGVVTSFKLSKDKNRSGIEYARIEPSVMQRLSKEERAQMEGMAKAYGPLLDQIARETGVLQQEQEDAI